MPEHEKLDRPIALARASDRAYRVSLRELFALTAIIGISLYYTRNWATQSGLSLPLGTFEIVVTWTLCGVRGYLLYRRRRQAESAAGELRGAMRVGGRSVPALLVIAFVVMSIVYFRVTLAVTPSSGLGGFAIGSLVIVFCLPLFVHAYLARFNWVEFREHGVLIGDEFFQWKEIELTQYGIEPPALTRAIPDWKLNEVVRHVEQDRAKYQLEGLILDSRYSDSE